MLFKLIYFTYLFYFLKKIILKKKKLKINDSEINKKIDLG